MSSTSVGIHLVVAASHWRGSWHHAARCWRVRSQTHDRRGRALPRGAPHEAEPRARDQSHFRLRYHREADSSTFTYFILLCVMLISLLLRWNCLIVKPVICVNINLLTYYLYQSCI